MFYRNVVIPSSLFVELSFISDSPENQNLKVHNVNLANFIDSIFH